jgi:hypothetical protein
MKNPLSLTIPALSFSLLLAFAPAASAVVIAGYNLGTASVTNSNSQDSANPAFAANTAAAQPGVTPSNLTIVGATNDLSISISGATASAYIQGQATPTADSIYTNARYFTFTVNLTSAFNLTSLTFDMAGTNSSANNYQVTFGARFNDGNGFTNLNTGSVSVPGGTGNTTNFGVYTADLSAYQNVTGPLTFQLFIADDTTNGNLTGRIRNIQLNASPIPEPLSALSLFSGFALLGILRRRN